MDISLESIDIIRDRTGVTYKEAKDSLVAANGNVVDALINIEDIGHNRWTETISVKGSEAYDKLKGIVKSGNVNRIRVKKDDCIILDIPVTAGAISVAAIPKLTAIGTAVALLSKCTIEVERPNKETINVSEAITNMADDIAGKIKSAAGDMSKEKSDLTGYNTKLAEEIETYGNDSLDITNVKSEDTFKQ